VAEQARTTTVFTETMCEEQHFLINYMDVLAAVDDFCMYNGGHNKLFKRLTSMA
jgi:hypothetical protein